MPQRSSNVATISGSRKSPVETSRRSRGERKRSSFGCSASARYSAGDWQRMLGPSRKSRSRRSSASNCPCWRTTSAPRDQGPTTVFHIVSAAAGSEVHQTASPRPTSSQCSAWTRVAKTEPCVCATSFRVPPTPPVEAMNARSREAVSAVGTFSGTSFELRRSPSSKRWTSGEKPMRSIVCASESTATTSAASVSDTWRSSIEAVTVGAQGTTTAPAFSAPRTTSSQSTVLPETTSTRSPWPMPRSCRFEAHRFAPSEISRKLRGSITPSLPRNVSARRLGSRASASTTSRVKLKRSGICQRPSTMAGRSASSRGELGSSAPRARRLPMRSPFTAQPLSTRRGQKLNTNSVSAWKRYERPSSAAKGVSAGSSSGTRNPPASSSAAIR